MWLINCNGARSRESTHGAIAAAGFLTIYPMSYNHKIKNSECIIK